MAYLCVTRCYSALLMFLTSVGNKQHIQLPRSSKSVMVMWLYPQVCIQNNALLQKDSDWNLCQMQLPIRRDHTEESQRHFMWQRAEISPIVNIPSVWRLSVGVVAEGMPPTLTFCGYVSRNQDIYHDAHTLIVYFCIIFISVSQLLDLDWRPHRNQPKFFNFFADFPFVGFIGEYTISCHFMKSKMTMSD